MLLQSLHGWIYGVLFWPYQCSAPEFSADSKAIVIGSSLVIVEAAVLFYGIVQYLTIVFWGHWQAIFSATKSFSPCHFYQS
jgi:alkyl hydroperoxide reductase subunit AhpF